MRLVVLQHLGLWHGQALKACELSGLEAMVYNQDPAPFASPKMLALSPQHQSPQGHQHSQKCETLSRGKLSVQTRNVPGQLPKQTLHLQYRLTTRGFGSLSLQLCYAKRDFR